MNKYLILILVLAALVRFVGLSELPAALNRDEAAIGYNAYSLINTGKDEHGQSWPLNFKSIGDYKMPGYIYATMLPVKILGLNDFSIRFWSALAGVVSVVAIYLISKSKISALLMALNPWAILYSRIGFEANLALAFFLLGLWLLLQRRSIGYLLWLLATLTYSSSLIFIPMFLVILWLQLKPKILPTLFFIATFGFIFVNLWTISAQKANVTVFSDPATIDYYNQVRTAVYERNPLLARTWWNKNVFFARKIAVNYVSTFSPQFLLTRGGGHPWQQIPNIGYFYAVEILLALMGIKFLFKTKHPWRWWVLAWLLLAPLASAITIDAPHATRSLYLLPVIIILASYGVPKKKSLQALLAGLYLVNFIYFGYQYLVKYPQFYRQNLPLGLEESIKFVQEKEISGRIYLTGIHDSAISASFIGLAIHDSAYLYPLVYTRFDPTRFQDYSVWTDPDPAGLTHAYQFGQFAIIDKLVDVVNPEALILPTNLSYPKDPAFVSGNYQVILW